MGARPNARARLIIGVVAFAAIVLIGALLVIVGSPGRQPSSMVTVAQPTPTLIAGTNEPHAEKAGLPVGFTHDRDGATAAAIAYATAPQRWLYFTDQQITDAVNAIATPTAAPRLIDDVLDEVRNARQRLGSSDGRIWWLVRPLAWRVDTFTPDDASVAVWVVTILSAHQVAAPQTEFVTATVQLAWADGDWHVDGIRDTAGPTPMTGPGDQPWDAEPFDKSLAGFTRMDGEPVQ